MYAIDIGNAFTSKFDGAQVISVRSVIADVPSRLNLRQGSNVIEYGGALYHVGEPAFKYDSYRMMATYNKQVGSSLTDSLILLLNVISSAELGDTTEIVLQVPEMLTNYQHDFVKLVHGFHTWVRDGIEYKTKIVVKQVYQEGYGSWYMAQRSNALDYDGYSIVMDLGGGTVITTLFDNSSGEAIKVYTYQHKGVVYLANLLIADYQLRIDNSGNVLTVESIFKGFENETYRVGVNGASFKPYIPRYTRDWWGTVWTTTVNAFQKQLQDRTITKVIVTGGGAEIVRPFVDAARSKPAFANLFMVSFDPLHDNIKGIFHAYNES